MNEPYIMDLKVINYYGYFVSEAKNRQGSTTLTYNLVYEFANGTLA